MLGFISCLWVGGWRGSSRTQTGFVTFSKTYDPVMVLQMFIAGRVSGEM